MVSFFYVYLSVLLVMRIGFMVRRVLAEGFPGFPGKTHIPYREHGLETNPSINSVSGQTTLKTIYKVPGNQGEILLPIIIVSAAATMVAVAVPRNTGKRHVSGFSVGMHVFSMVQSSALCIVSCLASATSRSIPPTSAFIVSWSR